MVKDEKIGTWVIRLHMFDSQVTVVEPTAFTVIGRSCLEGYWFDSHCPPGIFLRFNYRPIMFGTVGSLVSSGVFGPSTWVQFSFETLDINRVMTLSKLCPYTCALASQAIHPFESVNWYRQFFGIIVPYAVLGVVKYVADC